jgi:hypothetical protein
VAAAVDRVGLAHPGLLPEYWQRLRESGMDIRDIDLFDREAVFIEQIS